MAHLFEPFPLRGITLKNRIAVSPMCQYSATDGVPNDWHLVHLGSRAVGGAGLVIAEATAVEPDGRITPFDTGIYDGIQTEAWAKIARFIEAEGSVPGIQLAHAGRKASTNAPWHGGGKVEPQEGGWSPVWGASNLAFSDNYPRAQALDSAGLQRVRDAFRSAAKNSLDAGFKVAEVHGAHGYLLHQFLSPLSNDRKDEYGGSIENRMRFPLEICAIVREVWPDDLPVFLRISATDWAEEGGWDLDQSVELCREAKKLGVDLVDVSSGGTLPRVKIPVEAGYQVPFSERIRNEAGIATGAVGLISEPEHAEQIIAGGQADLVLLAREFLRDPYWPRRAASTLGAEIEPPEQYLRAW